MRSVKSQSINVWVGFAGCAQTLCYYLLINSRKVCRKSGISHDRGKTWGSVPISHYWLLIKWSIRPKEMNIFVSVCLWVLLCGWRVWEFACGQSGLCPCTGHPEVICFINDCARSALLHLRAVCSNGLLRMDCSHDGLHCYAGSCRSSHPTQFHSGGVSLIRPLGSLGSFWRTPRWNFKESHRDW